MREILFRGKEELTEYQINMGYKESKWVYGYYWTNEVGNHFIRVTRDEKQFYLFNDYEVIPETVGQFTGLTDKNGTKIFEGDIVRFTNSIDEVDNEVGKVIWEQSECNFVAQYKTTNRVRQEENGTTITIYLISNETYREDVEYEVIGNIHEKGK